MPKLEGKLTRGEQIASGTWAFTIDLGGQPFTYRAGQTIDLTYADAAYSDAAGNKRTFSIACAPGRGHLLIATRVRGSAFKRSLVEASSRAGKDGARLELDGPYGSFVLPQKPGSFVFLAGGIGITPFRAMIEDVITRGLEHRVELIHSNRTPEDAPFYAELTAWAKENPRFVYRPTMTDAGPGWTGERRKIGPELFGEWLPADRNAPVYYVAGPEGFVKAAVEGLGGMGVEEDRIKFEEFPGY